MDTAQKLNILDAENSVAGSILIDSRAYSAVADMLTPDAFQSELCRLIFQAAKDLAADGHPIDPVTISRRIQAAGVTIGNDTLVQLMEITPTAANVRYYAGAVLDHAKRRKLREVAANILEDGTTPTDELLSQAAGKVPPWWKWRWGAGVSALWICCIAFMTIWQTGRPEKRT